VYVAKFVLVLPLNNEYSQNILGFTCYESE